MAKKEITMVEGFEDVFEDAVVAEAKSKLEKGEKLVRITDSSDSCPMDKVVNVALSTGQVTYIKDLELPAMINPVGWAIHAYINERNKLGFRLTIYDKLLGVLSVSSPSFLTEFLGIYNACRAMSLRVTDYSILAISRVSRKTDQMYLTCSIAMRGDCANVSKETEVDTESE